MTTDSLKEILDRIPPKQHKEAEKRIRVAEIAGWENIALFVEGDAAADQMDLCGTKANGDFDFHTLMFDTVYGLNLSGFNGQYKATVDGGPGIGYMSSSLSAGYSDYFKKNRAPSRAELFSHLVGTAYRCAKANADLVAGTRLRQYLRTEEGQPKAKFVEAYDAMGVRAVRKVPGARIRHWKRSGYKVKSALLTAADRDTDLIEEVDKHPLLDVLSSPEDAVTDGGLPAYAHLWATVMQLEVIGAAYWYVKEWSRIPGAGKVPKRLILLRSHLVIERPDTSGDRYIEAYQYGSNVLDPEDVIRFAYVDPSSPHLGFLSPMRTAIDKIRLARGGDAFVEALLENGGYPTAVMSPADAESVIGDAEAARMVSGWRTATSQSKAGGLLVMKTANVKLQATAFKPAEVIDKERAVEIAGEICDCFDVPRTIVFRDSSNYSNADSGDEAHARAAGVPRCSLVEGVLNSQLVPLFDKTGRTFVAFDSPVPEDRGYLNESVKTQVTAGIQTVDGGRTQLGLDPLGGEVGDCLILPRGAILINSKTADVVDTGGAAAEPEMGGKNGQQGQKQPAKKKPKKSKSRRLMRKMLMRLKATREIVPASAPNSPPVGPPRPEVREIKPSITDRLLREGYTEAELTAMAGKHVCAAGEL